MDIHQRINIHRIFPIPQSRCAILRYTKLSDKQLARRLLEITRAEKVRSASVSGVSVSVSVSVIVSASVSAGVSANVSANINSSVRVSICDSGSLRANISTGTDIMA